MWCWFPSGWIIILPLALMVLCILMCIFARPHKFSGCGTCCSYRNSKSDTGTERTSQGDSQSSEVTPTEAG